MVAARRISVDVLKPDYSARIGTVAPGDLLSASCTWQWWGVGTGTLVVRETGPIAAQLMQARDYRVPVTMKATGYPRWDGYVVYTQAEKDTGHVGRVTATLVDDRKWLDRILAAPVPGSPWSDQTAAEHDRRTGSLATVVRQYVTANVARLAAAGQPVPIVVADPGGTDSSPTVTIDTRNETLADELIATLKANQYEVRAELWLPGDPQPPGLTLTTAKIVVSVVAGRSRLYVNFSDDRGSIASRTMTVAPPSATAVVVGGPGEGTARVFEYVVADDGRLTTLGDWGRSEVFLDATDADTQALRISRGKDKLDELAGKVGVSLTINDQRPWKAGPTEDYWVGDLVRATFSGVQAQDHITRISITANNDGFLVSPQFGDTSVTESSDLALARTVRELSQAISSLLARK